MTKRLCTKAWLTASIAISFAFSAHAASSVSAVAGDTHSNTSSLHDIGNNESVAVPRPAAGTYYVKVVGVEAFSGVSVQGSFIDPAPPL